MENLSINLIRYFIESHAVIIYFIIILGVIIEGEFVVILAGIFSHLGSINPFISLFCVIVGGVTKSFLGYLIGFHLQENHIFCLTLMSNHFGQFLFHVFFFLVWDGLPWSFQVIEKFL